ncbi:MAG: DUF2630 family protein [Chloroflexaceae bacterium]|jgi:hypothetical protein|nr:DUF2630 family protein [Chloroflexaceae bacterium]
MKVKLEEVIAAIDRLEEERRQMYADDRVTEEEHPRMREINHEIEQLWDLRRRIEAAIAAGLKELPVPPRPDPENMVG